MSAENSKTPGMEPPATSEALIEDYRIELVEPGCHPGSGAFGVRVSVTVDISPVFPYLHTLWEHANYDADNQILVGGDAHQRYALRPLEIRIGRVEDAADGHAQAAHIVERVNAVWRTRDTITPRHRSRRVPSALALFRQLPGTNCRECGRPTCLAFANDLRQGAVTVEGCPPLGAPEAADARQQIRSLFSDE